MIGKVIDICNEGTIIIVYLQSQSRIFTIVFDHRCFWSFIEDTVGSSRALIGREIEVEGPLGEQTVRFVA